MKRRSSNRSDNPKQHVGSDIIGRDHASLRWIAGGWLAHGLLPKRLLSLAQMLEVYAAAYIDIGMAIQSVAENLSASLAPDETLSFRTLPGYDLMTPDGR